MESVLSVDRSSEGSGCPEQFESDTAEPSSVSGSSELKAQKDFLIHKLTKFDTLAGLAVRYGLSVFDIKKANGLVSDRAMYARESIIIPLNPSSCDQGKLSEESMQEWMRPSTSKAPPQTRQFKSRTSASAWNTFMLVDDSEQRSISEIELEMLDMEGALEQRQQASMQRQRDVYSRAKSESFPVPPSATPALMRRPPVPSRNKSSSISEYLTSMATSFIQTTEQLFGTSSSSTLLPQTESLFDKLKKVTAPLSLYGNEDGQMGRGSIWTQTLRPNKASQGGVSSSSQKDMSKID